MISQRAAAAAALEEPANLFQNESLGEHRPVKHSESEISLDGSYNRGQRPRAKGRTMVVTRLVTVVLTAVLGILVGVMLADSGSCSTSGPVDLSGYPGEVGTEGMVATTNKFATAIGLQVLRSGGNAADAVSTRHTLMKINCMPKDVSFDICLRPPLYNSRSL